MSCRIVNIRFTNQYDYYIGRPSIYGNPYSSHSDNLAKFKVGSKDESILKFREYLISNTELLLKVEDLRDLTLGCYCIETPEYKIGDNIVCHGQIYQMYLTNKEYIINDDIFNSLFYEKRIYRSLF